jgi:hypothetical protein
MLGWRARVIGWSLVFVTAAGCGSATVGQGGAGEQCFANHSCNVGLTCASDLCVSLGAGAGTSGSGGNGPTDKGGAGGSSAPSTCIMGDSPQPSSALITNFSDAMASPTSTGDFTFGSSGAAAGMMGGTALFSSSATGTLSVSGGVLTFMATVATPTAAVMYPFNGFVVFVNGPACVNANAYTGVSFTYSSTGTCSVFFDFGDADHTATSSDPDRGTCTGIACYGSQFAVTGSGTIKMPFAGTPSNPGMPTAMVDAAKFTGVQWQLQPASSTATTSCTGTVTVGDISFY